MALGWLPTCATVRKRWPSRKRSRHPDVFDEDGRHCGRHRNTSRTSVLVSHEASIPRAVPMPLLDRESSARDQQATDHQNRYILQCRDVDSDSPLSHWPRQIGRQICGQRFDAARRGINRYHAPELAGSVSRLKHHFNDYYPYQSRLTPTGDEQRHISRSTTTRGGGPTPQLARHEDPSPAKRNRFHYRQVSATTWAGTLGSGD